MDKTPILEGRQVYPSHSKLYVEVDLPEHQLNNPWLAKAGMFANDPTWGDVLGALADYRKQLDAKQAEDI